VPLSSHGHEHRCDDGVVARCEALGSSIDTGLHQHPHPGALAEGRSKSRKKVEGQKEKFNYIQEAAREGNERNMFKAMLAKQGVSAEESEPYRKALDSDEALRAVYNYYRAIPLWMKERLDAVPMPTLFIWPTGSENVASASIEANANWVKGPYRLDSCTNSRTDRSAPSPDPEGRHDLAGVPCTFPADQGSDSEDEFAPDSPHRH
jgi:hypothetical protein